MIFINTQNIVPFKQYFLYFPFSISLFFDLFLMALFPSITNEAGASVYSVSTEAVKEMPDLDPNLRSAGMLVTLLLLSSSSNRNPVSPFFTSAVLSHYLFFWITKQQQKVVKTITFRLW